MGRFQLLPNTVPAISFDKRMRSIRYRSERLFCTFELHITTFTNYLFFNRFF